MYKPTFDKHIDFQEEKSAIIEFCNKHWTVKENTEDLVGLVDFLFEFGNRLATNRFNSVEISSAFRELLKAETENMCSVKNTTSSILDNYNKISNIYFSIEEFESYSNSQNSLNYDVYMPKLLKEVKAQFSTLKNIKPVGWKKYSNNPDSVDDYSKTDSKFFDFKGSKSAIGMYVWLSFPDQHTLSSVAYNDERGRKPFETLVASIVNQSYASQIHNNTVDMLNELKGIVDNKKLDKESLEEITTQVENKTLKVLFDLGTVKNKKNADLEESLKQTILASVEYGPEISQTVVKKNKM